MDSEKWRIYKKISLENNNADILLSEPIFNACSNEATVESALSIIENELSFMSKILIFSTLGMQLISTNEYLDGQTNSRRFVFNFRSSLTNNSYQYALDLQKGCFVQLESALFTSLIRQFPYGIDVFLEDFFALLDGKIQIWELATANMRQWYLGDKLDSPIAFLYKYFSEQVRPDLAEKVYKNLYAQ